MQSSEFIKSAIFGSKLKKKLYKKLKMNIFYLKTDFYRWKKFVRCIISYIQIDLSDATIRIQNFDFSRKLWWKNWWNYIVAEKRILSKLSKISNPNFDSIYWRLECRLCKIFLSFIVFEKYDVMERDGQAWSGFSLIYFYFGQKNFNVQ